MAGSDEINEIGNVVAFVWNRLTDFVDIAFDHPSMLIPVGFAVALATVSLFRSAMGASHNDRFA